MSDVKGMISLKLADGTLFPVMESLAPNKTSLVLEPANPGEKKAKLTFFLETEEIKETVSVISVDLPEGHTGISVSVEIDPLRNLFIVVRREGAEERQVDQIALNDYLLPNEHTVSPSHNNLEDEISGKNPSRRFLYGIAVALFSIFGVGLVLFTVFSLAEKMASPPFPPLRANVESSSR